MALLDILMPSFTLIKNWKRLHIDNVEINSFKEFGITRGKHSLYILTVRLMLMGALLT